MAEIVTFEDAERRVLQEEGTDRVRVEWKSGTEATRATLETRAIAALDANATFLALTTPTNAQNAAQVKTLTRECNGLIRLLLERLDSTEGT